MEKNPNKKLNKNANKKGNFHRRILVTVLFLLILSGLSGCDKQKTSDEERTRKWGEMVANAIRL